MRCINMHKPIARRLFSAGLVRVTAAIALSLHLSVSHSNALDQSIHIALGQQGAEIVKQSPVLIEQSEARGSRIYEAGWYIKRMEPMVVLDDDDRSVTFSVAAKKVDFYELVATGGVDDISIELRLPELPQDPVDSRVMADHDEAVRKIVQETIDRINQALWQRKIWSDRQTSSGRDSIAFMRSYQNRGDATAGQSTSGIDPSYRMTPEEWANLAGDYTGHYWRWIKNGASITMCYSRKKWHVGGLWQAFERLRVRIASDDATSFRVYDLRIPPDDEL